VAILRQAREFPDIGFPVLRRWSAPPILPQRELTAVTENHVPSDAVPGIPTVLSPEVAGLYRLMAAALMLILFITT
jgi:hypothetical protein